MDICGVCGAKAIGRNFGALTCESCKTFFRRALTKYNIKHCHFDNKCQINEQNRRMCKKCRLDKCFEIGMKKELLRVWCQRYSQSPDPLTSWSSAVMPELSPFSDEMSDVFVSEQTLSEDDWNSTVDNYQLNDEEMNEEIRQLEQLLNDSQSNANLKASTSSVVSIVRPMVTFDKELNDMEWNRIKELTTAAVECLNFMDNSSDKYCFDIKSKEDYTEFFGYSIADQVILGTIKFCKRLTMFDQLCDDDKTSLFRNSCWKIICLTSFPSHNLEQECFTIYIGKDYWLRFHSAIFKYEYEQVYKLIKNFWKNLYEEWMMEINLVTLLAVIDLFYHDTPNLAHKEITKLNKQMYIHLLRRYLTQKYKSEDKSSESMSKLMTVLMEMHKINQKIMSFWKNFGQSLTPLVRETLNIDME